MKMIGVGFGRTGTMSLKAALEGAGRGSVLPHDRPDQRGRTGTTTSQHWIKIADGEPVDWDEVFDGWEATVDWPAASKWRERWAAFPDVPVLLNVRDFDGFYKSCANTILAVKEAAQAGELGPRTPTGSSPRLELWGVTRKLIWQGDFQGRFQDKEWVREMYWDRVETIKREVPPNRLVYWELGDGWEPLADALGVEAPDKPFPHLHDTNEFRAEFGLPALA